MATKITGTNTAASPGVTGDDTDTGLFYGTNEIGFSTGGTSRMTLDSDALTVSGELVINHDDWNAIRALNTKDDIYGAYLVLAKKSSSPADNDQVGVVNFRGDNDAGEELTYGTIIGKSTDVTDGTEDGQLEFYTVGNGTYAERLRITSDGKVGLNEDTPLADLHIITVGSSGQNGVLQLGGSGASLGLKLEYDQTGNTVSKITANPTYTNASSQLKICVDGDNNADQLVLTGNGNVEIGDGNLIIGTAGHGIDFSATSDAGQTSELLHDYEEGSFSPTIADGISSPSYANQYGRYTKIGNKVTIWFYVSTNGGTATSAHVQFGGMPYAAANNTCYVALSGYNNNSASTITGPIPIIFPNTSTIYYYQQGNTNPNTVAGTEMGQPTSQLWWGTYEAA